MRYKFSKIMSCLSDILHQKCGFALIDRFKRSIIGQNRSKHIDSTTIYQSTLKGTLLGVKL